MLDPGSFWKVRCLSATIAGTKPNGDPWDAFTTANNAAPDPFCQLSLGQSVAAKTSILANTFMPAWNEWLTPQSPLAASLLGSQAAPWSIQVVDDDGSTQGTDPICSVSPTLPVTAFSTGSATFSDVGSCTSLSIGLECASP
jgi:hypothetical protein